MAALIAGAIALTGFGAGTAAVPATFVAVSGEAGSARADRLLVRHRQGAASPG